MRDEPQKWQLRWEPAPLRQLKKLPRAVQPRLIAAAESLASDPRPAGVTKLTDVRHASGTALYRVRSGDYRVVYTPENEQLIVLVVPGADHKEVYR